MSEALLTSVLTVLTGIVILVIGEIVQKFAIEPVHELRKLIGEIHFDLSFYGPYYSTPGSGEAEGQREASASLRRKASLLKALDQALFLYWLWEIFQLVPKRGNLLKAHELLLHLSYSILKGDTADATRNHEVSLEIERLLYIK